MEILNKMLRGEVWWVNFEPSKGGEITKTRPAIIVSNNMANKMLNRLQVVPITSNTKKLYPGSGIPSFYIAHKISFQTPCCSSKEVNNVIS